MAKDNLIGCKLDDEELKLFNSLVFQSGLNQTDYIKSKIFPSSETEEDRQEIKNLLFKIHEQNDIIQKILLSSSNKDNNSIPKIKTTQKQVYIAYALIGAILFELTQNTNKDKVHKLNQEAKAKADELFGKDE